jgi:hypothetical protein
MPRKARIDGPGVVDHIIVRGIERRSIFKDDHDRERFTMDELRGVISRLLIIAKDRIRNETGNRELLNGKGHCDI